MAERRVRLIFRPLTKFIFIILMLVSIGNHIGLILFPEEVKDYYDSFDRSFEGYPGAFSDRANLIFWSIIALLFLLEFINLLFVNHKQSLLSEREIEELTSETLGKRKTMIIIPALNEEASIQKAIETASPAGDVLVMDDGSTDRTREIAKEHADAVIAHSRNMGLAKGISNSVDFCIKEGYKQMVIFDADLQYTRKDLINVIKVLENSSNDLVMGSRLSGTVERMKLTKRFGNWLFSKVLSFITGIPISDGQTGLRAFTDTFAGNIKFRGQFTYTQEMLFETSKLEFNMAEIPIDFKERAAGSSRLMASAFDYAVRAWSLNLQILAEYNPLKFSLLMIGVLLTFSFSIISKGFTQKATPIIILISVYFVLFYLGIFFSVVVNRLDLIDRGINYKIIKANGE